MVYSVSLSATAEPGTRIIAMENRINPPPQYLINDRYKAVLPLCFIIMSLGLFDWKFRTIFCEKHFFYRKKSI